MPGYRFYGNRRAWLRARHRERARSFFTRHAVYVTQRMGALKPAEIEWRVRLLTLPDTRSLIGRLAGDPVYERSALFAKRMGWL